MKRTVWALSRILLLGCGACVAHSRAESTGGPFSIDATVIASGGGSIGGGDLQMSATIGQAASATLIGANYTFFDGFWHPIDAADDVIFSNGFDL